MTSGLNMGRLQFVLVNFGQAGLSHGMRIVLSLYLTLSLFAGAHAQDAAAPQYERVLFAGQVGNVSAMALGPNGTVYAADYTGGRVFRLTDRGLDGRLDSKQKVADGLVQPSGLAVVDERLFVSDVRAIWEVLPRTGDLKRVANLSNARAEASPRPLIAGQDSQSVIISLSNLEDNGGRLVSVDITSGSAQLVSSGPSPLAALAAGPGGSLWAASDAYILPVLPRSYSLEAGSIVADRQQVAGLILPGNPDQAPASLSDYPDHIFASVNDKTRANISTGTRETSVYAVPTRFGRPAKKAIKILGGIASRRTQAGDMPTGAMLIDSRGIFLADSANHTIWRIRKSPPKPAPAPIADAPIKLDQPKSGVPAAVLDPKGSAIAQGSLIEKGTTIDIGSTIPEDE